MNSISQNAIIALAAVGAFAGVSPAADGVQAELYSISCQYVKQTGMISNPPCMITLRLSASEADAMVCSVDQSELTATDAKDAALKVSQSAFPVGVSDHEDSAKYVTLKLDKLPKGGSMSLVGVLKLTLAAGAEKHEPQAFQVEKGGSFQAGSVAYTLSPSKGADFFGFSSDESGTSVKLSTKDDSAIKDVSFTTKAGKEVRVTTRMKMGDECIYTLDTKETDLNIAISTYKDAKVVDCPVNMTINLSGVMKKSAAGDDSEKPAKPTKTKKAKKK